MGNCQAVDNATIAIQYPNGRVDKLYCPVAAGEIMRLNPGHYVALLLTTTLYSSTAAAPAAAAAAASGGNAPLRITRIKLLRASDTLALGHVYRLVTSQEVMKGLWAKKKAQMQKNNGKTIMTEKQSSYFEGPAAADVMKTNQARQERHSSSSSRPRGNNNTNNTPLNSAGIKAAGGRTWQPALKSISESLG